MSSSVQRNRGPSAGPANRAALIAAAREVFAEGGYTSPLSAVARRAGVGQGSLYRHFPDRVALAVAVFDENIGELERMVDETQVSLDDLLDRIIEQALVSTAFIDMITADPDDQRVAHLGQRISAVAETVVARERSARRIAEHVSTDDVILAVSMLAGVLARTPTDQRRAVAQRAWSLFRTSFAPH